jgi:hypothetical protein
VEQQKTDETIGNLYRLKELYRVQGEDVCMAAEELIVKILVLDVKIVNTMKAEIAELAKAIEKFNA